MRKIITGIILLSLLTMNLFAATAIVKIKKPNGNTQRFVFDSNQKIATFITLMSEKGFKIKAKKHTSGVGTFAEASEEKPYYCLFYTNAPDVTMFMWKSDFDEVIAEMQGEKK